MVPSSLFHFLPNYRHLVASISIPHQTICPVPPTEAASCERPYLLGMFQAQRFPHAKYYVIFIFSATPDAVTYLLTSYLITTDKMIEFYLLKLLHYRFNQSHAETGFLLAFKHLGTPPEGESCPVWHVGRTWTDVGHAKLCQMVAEREVTSVHSDCAFIRFIQN